MSIRRRLFLVIFLVCVLCAALYEGLAWYAGVNLVRKGVDAHLSAAARALTAILPPDFQDKVLAGKVSAKEYDALQKRMNAYAESVGVTYLFTLAQKDGNVIFTIDDDMPPFTVNQHPTSEILDAFKTGEKFSWEGYDTYYNMRARSVLVPMRSPEGHLYLAGAHLNTTFLSDLLKNGLIKLAIAMGVGAIIALLLAIVLSHYISAPLVTLASFAKVMAAEDFPPDIRVPGKLLPKNPKTNNEIAYLALSFQTMLEKLDAYLKKFEQEVSARERVENELKIAGQIQADFLPPALGNSEGLCVSAFMKPAKEAGGDFYEYFYLDADRLCFAVGDVAGKGMPAALFMARAMTLIRPSAQATQSLSDVASLMNQALCVNNERCMFITFFIGVLEISTGTLRFVNCGHNPPVLRAKNGSAAFLKSPPSTVLGINEMATFEIRHSALNHGETLLLYTDGVTEAMDCDDSFYGDERLLSTVAALPVQASAETVLRAVANDVSAFAQGCPQADDITLLSLCRPPVDALL